jgi:DNA (cytosine-5)-methyltransferase 1
MTDIIFAGVPCQSFSSIGKRNGLDDNNGEIILYLINHILPTVRPKFLVIENVKGLLTHDNSKTFNYILDLIKKQNYHVVYKLIACYNYGIPQNRQRLFIICSIEDISQESFDKYLNDTMIPSRTLSEYLGKPFERDIAYTIRCGGLGSPITSKQNWDGYIVDGEEYRLTLEDKLLLQGFDLDFRLYGNNKERSNLVGNTIPTNLSKIIAEFVCEYLI